MRLGCLGCFMVILSVLILSLPIFGYYHENVRGVAAKSLERSRRRKFLRDSKFSEFVTGDPEIMWTIYLAIFAALAGLPLYKILVERLEWI